MRQRAGTSRHLKGSLDLLLLGVLADGPAHGYAVIAELRERSTGSLDLPEGTVYPALHKLEQDGLVASEWDASTGRRRRLYALTRRGRRRLAAEREDWFGFARTVGAVLGAPVPTGGGRAQRSPA